MRNEVIQTERKELPWKSRAGWIAMILAAALLAAGCGGQKDAAEATASVETAASGEAGGAQSVSEESDVSAGEADNQGDAAQGDTAPAEAGDASEQEAGADPKAVYEAVGQAVELPSMMEGDDDFISNYYGIDPEALDGYVFASAEDATLADSVIIMKVKSEDAVAGIEECLNTVLSQKAAEMEDYIPEQYEIVSRSSVKTEGLYVYLVISEKAGDIESVIQSALK